MLFSIKMHTKPSDDMNIETYSSFLSNRVLNEND